MPPALGPWPPQLEGLFHHRPGDPFSPILLFPTSLCSPPAATGGPPKSGNTSFRFSHISDCISHPKRASLKPGTHPVAAWGKYSQTPWLRLPSLQAQLQGGTRTHKTPSQKQMNEQVNKKKQHDFPLVCLSLRYFCHFSHCMS